MAKIIGVSRSTVSNAYNRPDQLSQTLRKHILSRAKELGYQGPSAAGRMLRTGKAQAVGLICYERFHLLYSDEHALAALKGISQVMEENGVSLLMIPTMSTSTQSNQALSALVDSFIVFSGYQIENNPLIKSIESRGLPIAALDYKYGDFPRVGIDDYSAAKQVAINVAQCGHQHIAVMAMAFSQDAKRGFVSEQRYQSQFQGTSVLRAKGYTDGFKPFNVEVSIFETAAEDVSAYDGDQRSFVDSAHRILDEKPELSVIVCMSDHMALAVLQAAAERELRVPIDLSVVGFDGIPSALAASPQLTTMVQPTQEKGRTIARMVLGQQAMQDTHLTHTWNAGESLALITND